MIKIVAMSTICADVFDDTEEIRLGGEALNFAMTISKLSSKLILSLLAGMNTRLWFCKNGLNCIMVFLI